MGTGPEERIFSEQEVSQILNRAVELTEQQSERGYAPGITRQELERIAKEVGVSPNALLQAISELQGSVSNTKGTFHLSEEFERVIEGEMDPDMFDVILEDLKPLANAGQPHASQIGRKLSASIWTGISQAKIDVTARNGRTKLVVKSNSLYQGLMTLYPAVFGALISVGVLADHGKASMGVAIGGLILGAGVAAFTALTRLGHRKAEKIANDLRSRIAETLQTGSDLAQGTSESEVIRQQLGGA